MKIIFIQIQDTKLAHILSDEIIINTTDDALDLMMNCIYQGAESIILYEKNIIPAFFDLKTQIAGDILQKFSTYNAKLAIIGTFKNVKSNSLKSFIYESNKQAKINFVDSLEEAKKVLTTI